MAEEKTERRTVQATLQQGKKTVQVEAIVVTEVRESTAKDKVAFACPVCHSSGTAARGKPTRHVCGNYLLVE